MVSSLLTDRSALLHTRDTLPPSSSISDVILIIAVTMFPVCVNISRSFIRCAGDEAQKMGRHGDRVDLLSMYRRLWFFTSMLLCVCGFRSAIRVGIVSRDKGPLLNFI